MAWYIYVLPVIWASGWVARTELEAGSGYPRVLAGLGLEIVPGSTRYPRVVGTRGYQNFTVGFSGFGQFSVGFSGFDFQTFSELK